MKIATVIVTKNGHKDIIGTYKFSTSLDKVAVIEIATEQMANGKVKIVVTDK